MLKFFRRVVPLLFVVIACSDVLHVAAGAAQGATGDSNDVAATVICNVVVFVQRLGLPIMTGVILGASIMAIFGKMAWASIVVLVVFTAIFFGAGKLMQKFAAGLSGEFQGADTFVCASGGTKLPAVKAAVARAHAS